MKIKLLKERFAVCRLAPDAKIPRKVLRLSFCAITRTEDELSIVLPEAAADQSWKIEEGWRGLKVEGPLDFEMVGVIAQISGPLAQAGIPIFVISTFDTDYLLIKNIKIDVACDVLHREGHVLDMG